MQNPGIFTRVLIMGIILASFVVFVFALVADEQGDYPVDRIGYVIDSFPDDEPYDFESEFYGEDCDLDLYE